MQPIQKIEKLIDEAQTVIKKSRKDMLEAPVSQLEKYLHEQHVPANDYYEEKDFYNYIGYPMMNYIDVSKFYNEGYSSAVGSANENCSENCDARMRIFIYNYISNVFYEKYQILSLVNVYYPNNNRLFKFRTYNGEARINKSMHLEYIHPIYILEDNYRKLYNPEYQEPEKLAEIHDEIKILYDHWNEINPGEYEYADKNAIVAKMTYDGDRAIAIEIAKNVEGVYECYYDKNIPVLICNTTAIRLISDLLVNKYQSAIKIEENDSKSFYDSRIKNVIYKLRDQPILKLYNMLDHELVPILPSGQTHIYVNIWLAFTEFITYDMVGKEKIMQIKLRLFTRMQHILQKLQNEKTIILLENCKFVGLYYPRSIYLKDLMIKNIIKKS